MTFNLISRYHLIIKSLVEIPWTLETSN